MTRSFRCFALCVAIVPAAAVLAQTSPNRTRARNTPAATAAPATTPGAQGVNPAAVLDARRIMEAVNRKYTSFINDPREVYITHTTVTRTLGAPDIRIEEEQIAYLQGDKARVETVDSDAFVHTPTHLEATPVRHLERHRVWVHDGDETKVYFEGAPSPPRPQPAAAPGQGTPPAQPQTPAPESPDVDAFYVNHDRLPANADLRFREPLASNEFDPVFLNSKFYAFASTYNGRPAYVLQSAAPVLVDADTTIQNAEFWVDAEAFLLLRIDMLIEQRREKAEPVFLNSDMEMVTNFNVKIDPRKFSLELPAGAVDLTPAVARETPTRQQ